MGCSGEYDALTIGVSAFNRLHDFSPLRFVALQPGANTEDIFEYVDSINRTFIGGYHQTIGAGGGYFLVSCAPTRIPQ